jgi:hypothetical protein
MGPTSDKEYLVTFLQKVKCGQDEHSLKEGCTAQEVQSAQHIVWKDQVLQEATSPRLKSKKRLKAFAPADQIEKLVETIDRYFSDPHLQHLRIFQPLKMPATLAAAGFGRDEFQALATKLGLPLVSVWEDWNELLKQIIPTLT